MPSFPLRGVSLLKVGVHPPKQVVRLGFCPHQEGAPPLRPRVTFPTRGKSPKARQGLPPLDPAKGDASLPLRRCRHPLDRVSATNPARFATLRWRAKRPCFLPKLHRESHPLLLIRGAAVRFVDCVPPGVSPLSGGSSAARCWGDDNAPQGEYPEGIPFWEILW